MTIKYYIGRSIRILPQLIVALTLASCAADGTGLLDIDTAARRSESVSRPAPYDPFGAGAAKPTPTIAPANTVIAALPSPSGPPKPSAAIPTSDFSGLTADALKAQWGTPSLTRAEAGGALWQYQGRGCVVLAYLYPNSRGLLETAYAEARPGGDTAEAVRSCLDKGAKPVVDARSQQPKLQLKPN